MHMGEIAVRSGFKSLDLNNLKSLYPFFLVFLFVVAFHPFTVLIHCTSIHFVLYWSFPFAFLFAPVCNSENGWLTHVQSTVYVPFLYVTVVNAAT